MKGYVSSALPVPVHVQNLVVREYCKARGFAYEMSQVENKDNFAVLERLLASSPDGIVAYSLEQFDCERLARVNCELHFAMEGFKTDSATVMLIKLKAILG